MGGGCRSGIMMGYNMERMNISQMISGGMELIGDVACPGVERILVEGGL
jgi:hypothetical protein